VELESAGNIVGFWRYRIQPRARTTVTLAIHFYVRYVILKWVILE